MVERKNFQNISFFLASQRAAFRSQAKNTKASGKPIEFLLKSIKKFKKHLKRRLVTCNYHKISVYFPKIDTIRKSAGASHES